MDDINLEFVEIMGSTVRPVPVVVREHPAYVPGFPSSKQYECSMRVSFDVSVTAIDIIANPTKNAALLPKEDVTTAEVVSLLASVLFVLPNT